MPRGTVLSRRDQVDTTVPQQEGDARLYNANGLSYSRAFAYKGTALYRKL